MMNAKQILANTEQRLLTAEHITLEEANAVQLHNALSAAAMDALSGIWAKKEAERSNGRQAYYLSMEYLVGRLVYNNLYCMGVLQDLKALLAERGVDLAMLEDIEDDAFGNGGLGRLAACFLDSAVTCNIPLTGYGLRFRYGLFKQSFVDGKQHEEPDDWARFGDSWSIRRADQAVVVSMKTGDVLAVPYDMPVVGFGAKNVGTLRLWQTESLHEIDFPLFNEQEYARASADKNRAEDITKFLYPNDTKNAGRQMRVKQQYVLVSATLQDILRNYRLRHGDDYAFFSAEVSAQLNDTHPTMAIPELIRLLELDGIPFEDAFLIARDTFAYTNHTVMQEALEKWDLTLLSSVCPDIVRIMRKIDSRFRREMKKKGLEITPDFCIIHGKRVHMAELAVYATHAVNGVAELHSRILRDDLFSKWYAIYPERFQNKTNGITQRRWLGLCNPELCDLIAGKIGGGFETDLDRLSRLDPLIDEKLALAFRALKQQKKQQLAEAIEAKTGVTLNPTMVFDVQVKRLHEYKRQFMNALSILAIHDLLKRGELPDLPPVAFIFGAKAAPGYQRAKAVIYWINQIAEKVNRDPDTKERLKVVFVPNYNCSWAELIIPAADISEQISLAGTEASGTSNMKFALNGALTIGTMDGANVEMYEHVGADNIFIFGMNVEEVNELRSKGYNPKSFIERNQYLKRAVELIRNDFFSPATRGVFQPLVDSLNYDYYMVAADFDSYLETHEKLAELYRDPAEWNKRAIHNIANMGTFSSDRSIREYAEKIWKIKADPVTVKNYEKDAGFRGKTGKKK